MTDTPLAEIQCPGTQTHFQQTEHVLEPGERSVKHHHKETEETYYVGSGEGCIIVGNKRHEVKARDYVLVHTGQSHRIENTGSEPLIILSTKNRPRSFKDFYKDE